MNGSICQKRAHTESGTRISQISRSSLSFIAFHSKSSDWSVWSRRTAPSGGRYAQCGSSPSFFPCSVTTTGVCFDFFFDDFSFLLILFRLVEASGAGVDIFVLIQAFRSFLGCLSNALKTNNYVILPLISKSGHVRATSSSSTVIEHGKECNGDPDHRWLRFERWCGYTSARMNYLTMAHEMTPVCNEGGPQDICSARMLWRQYNHGTHGTKYDWCAGCSWGTVQFCFPTGLDSVVSLIYLPHNCFRCVDQVGAG